MPIEACWDCGPHLGVYLIVAAVVFFAPVGAFVLRKHIAVATGWWKAAGRVLQLLAALSVLPAVLVIMA